MNLASKIIILLITIMSVVFMAFAVAVYMTHQNWRAAVERPATEVGPGKPLGLRHKLQEVQTQNETLQTQLSNLQAAVQSETQERPQRLAKLEHARVERVSEAEKIQAAHTELVTKQDESVAELKKQSDALQLLTAEIAKLRQEIAATQQKRNQHFNNVVTTTEQVHQQQRQLRLLEERRVQLDAQVKRAQSPSSTPDPSGTRL